MEQAGSRVWGLECGVQDACLVFGVQGAGSRVQEFWAKGVGSPQ